MKNNIAKGVDGEEEQMPHDPEYVMDYKDGQTVDDAIVHPLPKESEV